MNTKETQQVMANKKKTMGELEQELYEVRQRQTLNQIKTPTPTKLDQLPDPKKHQYVSFVKSLVNGLLNLATANNSLLSLYIPTVVTYV